MLPDCSREYLLKKILIGKFQFLWAKPNPMPDCSIYIFCVMCYQANESYFVRKF